MNSWRNFLTLCCVAVSLFYIFGTSLHVAAADDVNECDSVSTNNCSQNASCHNFIGGYNCSCKDGFTGDGFNCADIDECSDTELHNCSSNATCMNSVGNFSCSCNSGYIGDGVTCTDVNECDSVSTNNCSQNASCHNFGGGYNCNCKDGFTGDGFKCADINECFQVNYPCSRLATCKNTVGNFDCTCSEGYSGNRTHCEDVDECVSLTHTCSNFAKCTNNDGGYKCDCNDDFVGDGFKCLEKPMIDYNTEVQVQQNKLFGPYSMEHEIVAFSHSYRNIYVSANGYIALGDKSQSYAQPSDGTFPKVFPILAPFWTAFDVAAPGKIFIDYYKYCNDKQILEKIGNMISPTFDAKRAVVVTWKMLSPYPASVFANETITFQGILVSSGSLFYAIFNYDKNNVKLNAEANRDILVGYSDGNTKSVTFARDKKFFDLLETENEVYGLRKTFKIGERNESSLNCLEWHCESKKKKYNIDSFAIPCPCTEQQANLDTTFKALNGMKCYENRFSINGTTQRCCYSQAKKALFKNYPNGGFIYNTNQSFPEGQKYCCEDFKLCNLFYDIHPSDTCSKYKVPMTVFVLDPLVFKMINKKWTSFYGAGEYTLLTVKAPDFDTSVTIQVRVELEDNDQFSKIPVYTAFAIKSEKAVLEITKGGIVMIKNDTDDIFEEKNNFIYFNNMHLEIISVNDSMGVILTIPHYLVQSNSLSGLLTGKMPDGKNIDSSSKSDVYKMWEACRVEENDSLLNYTHQNYSSFNSYNISENQFIGILSNFSDLVNRTETKCQMDDMFCIYAAVLKKANLANHTLMYNSDYFETIENFPPFLQNTLDQLYLKPGTNKIVLQADDRNNDNFTIEVEPGTNDYKFENGTLIWNLNLNYNVKDLKVWAKDSRGAASLYWPEVLFCGCKENEKCSKSESIMFAAKNPKRFYNLHCTCNDNYSGKDCDKPFDICTTKPCYRGVTCNSSRGEKDICGSCPTGLNGNGQVCYDVNFCSKGVCSQNCKDNIGDTYVCSCINGYKLAADNKTCEDINECTVPPKCSGFGQYCFNIPGSFQCKCKTGYISNNGTCESLVRKNKFSGSMSIELRTEQQKKMAQKLADKSSKEYETTSESVKKSILDKIGTNNVVVIDDIVTNQGNRTKRSTDQNSMKVIYTVYGDVVNQAELEKLLKANCDAVQCNFNGFFVNPDSLQINAQNMCNENICHPMSTNCKEEEKGFRCMCKPGFETSPQYGLFQCKDIDECNITQPCGSIPCMNTFGGYKCSCKFGYVFKNKSKSCVDVCAENPCKNGECIKLEESYQCSCHDGWAGKHCEKEHEEKKRMQTAAIVVGVVLGIICLVLIGIIVYIIRKYKKTSDNVDDETSIRSSIPRVNVKKDDINMSRIQSPSNIYSNADSGKENQAFEPDDPNV